MASLSSQEMTALRDKAIEEGAKAPFHMQALPCFKEDVLQVVQEGGVATVSLKPRIHKHLVGDIGALCGLSARHQKCSGGNPPSRQVHGFRLEMGHYKIQQTMEGLTRIYGKPAVHNQKVTRILLMSILQLFWGQSLDFSRGAHLEFTKFQDLARFQ